LVLLESQRAAPMTKPQNESQDPGHGATSSGTQSRMRMVTVSPERSATGSGDVARSDPYLGATVDGRYVVEVVLGQGGMGVVYRCTHSIIGKKVAMKVLRADMARDPEVTERFLNEARAASAIGNAHIIDISDFGQFPDGSTYFIMEHLSGTPLSTLLEGQKAIEPRRLVKIARQLCDGLAAAHEAGIVHRDLKPDNVFLIQRGGDPDFVKILDFGIAKVSTGGEKLTRAGAVFGTPHYMSPEQAGGTPVDARGDVYSLGVMLYEMASGRVPFDAENLMGILTQHLHKPVVPLRKLELPFEIDPGLDAIVQKCLSKNADDRYPDMRALGADLGRFERGEEPEALREISDRTPRSTRGTRSGAGRSLALAALALVCVVGLAALLLHREPAPGAAAPQAISSEPAALPTVQPGPVVAPVAPPPARSASATPSVETEKDPAPKPSLAPKPPKHGRSGAPSKPKKSPQIGGSEIVNPWD
jgi:serine/threonine protein kinase